MALWVCHACRPHTVHVLSVYYIYDTGSGICIYVFIYIYYYECETYFLLPAFSIVIWCECPCAASIVQYQFSCELLLPVEELREPACVSVRSRASRKFEQSTCSDVTPQRCSTVCGNGLGLGTTKDTEKRSLSSKLNISMVASRPNPISALAWNHACFCMLRLCSDHY